MREIRVGGDDNNFVYALTEPDGSPDNPLTVRYIGVSKSPQARFYSHLNSGSGGGWKKAQWIDRHGGKVKMFVIDGPFERQVALDKETEWIRFYLDKGADLFNYLESLGTPISDELRKNSAVNVRKKLGVFDGVDELDRRIALSMHSRKIKTEVIASTFGLSLNDAVTWLGINRVLT